MPAAPLIRKFLATVGCGTIFLLFSIATAQQGFTEEEQAHIDQVIETLSENEESFQPNTENIKTPELPNEESIEDEAPSAPEEPKVKKYFNDLNVGLRSYFPLTYFAQHKLLDGYEDNTIRPDNLITRAEAIVFAKRALIDFDSNQDFEKQTLPQANATKPLFSDVTIDHWAAGAIQHAKENGIINGYPDGSFHPDEPINLAEATKILMLTEKQRFPEMTFPTPETEEELFFDVWRDQYFSGYVRVGMDRDIFRFGFKNKIYPEQKMTREYFFDMTYRLLKSRDPNVHFGKGTYYSDFFEGRGTSNGETYTQNGYTAANKTLPFGTFIRTTNLKNGQSVVVRINDRGPFYTSLDVDYTSRAFGDIAAHSEGIIPIQFDIVGREQWVEQLHKEGLEVPEGL